MATLTVTTNADSGTGSLRQAIADAASGDTITFNTSIFPTNKSTQISLSSTLTIDKALTFNALSGDVRRVTINPSSSYRVVISISFPYTITFKGFVFTSSTLKSNNGGAISVDGSSLCTLVMQDCDFVNISLQKNYHGGALYARQKCKATFTRCRFESLSVSGQGVGSVVYGSDYTNGPFTFDNCSFINNTNNAIDIYNTDNIVTISNCVFSGSGDADILIGTNSYHSANLKFTGINILSSGIVTSNQNGTLTINISGYCGVANFQEKHIAATFSGSGFLAIPSSASITLPSGITRSEYGAGISSFTPNGTSLTWSTTNATKSVLLEKQNGSIWDTLNSSATSPYTVSEEGTYRIWDGETFLTTPISLPQTLVVTNTNDSGSGSLRDILSQARDVDTVTFDASLSGSTITLASGLTLTNAATIVGLVDASGDPAITISGANTYRILSGNYQMTLSNLIFTNAGDHAIYNEDADGSSFVNCVFSNNSATDTQGGAVYLEGTTSGSDVATFTDCVFSNNTSAFNTVEGIAGALFAQGISINASNCTFSNNKAEGDKGGAIVFFSSYDTLTLNDCTFSGNCVEEKASATGSYTGDCGGAIYSSGVIVATDCTFTSNTVNNQYDGDRGGAVYVGYDGTFTRCDFTSNSAKVTGGAAYAVANASFVNCSFSGNAVTYNSGLVGKDATQGGAIFSRSSVSCNDCTFSNNTSAQFGSSLATVNGSFSLTNCIFSGGSTTTFDVFLVRNGSTTSLTLNGGNDLKTGVATYAHSGTPDIYNAQYNGVGGYEVKSGNAPSFSGSGHLALPPSATVALPGTITRTEYGAGISALTSDGGTVSWSSVDSTKSVLLEKQNGSTWTTISTSATSPTTVASTGNYRIWDGSTFLAKNVSVPLVVTNTNDSGAGSLRAAINSATADDTIIFAPSLAGETIRLRSGLSSANGATIVGLTDDDGNPAITLDGSPDVEILTSAGPVIVSNINFTNGNCAYWSSGGFDGTYFINCAFSGFAINVIEVDNSSANVQSVSLKNCEFSDNDQADVDVSGSQVEVNLAGGNVLREGVNFSDAGLVSLINTKYNGVGGYTAPSSGTASLKGSGRIALPSDAELVPATNNLTVSEYGAGISAFTSSGSTLSWSSTDSTKSVLLEKENGSSWDVVDDDATSPATVSINASTVFRIWDGLVFLTTTARVISDHAWVVYANAIAVDSTPAIVVTTGYLMMSSYYNRGETPILFARLEDSETGDPLDDDLVESASYTCYRRTYYWGVESLTPVDGHENVAVPTSAFLSSLVTTDDRWTTDTTGYNFKFEPDATQNPLFPVAGSYVVVVTVNLTSGNPVPIVYEVSVQ